MRDHRANTRSHTLWHLHDTHTLTHPLTFAHTNTHAHAHTPICIEKVSRGAQLLLILARNQTQVLVCVSCAAFQSRKSPPPPPHPLFLHIRWDWGAKDNVVGAVTCEKLVNFECCFSFLHLNWEPEGCNFDFSSHDCSLSSMVGFLEISWLACEVHFCSRHVSIIVLLFYRLCSDIWSQFSGFARINRDLG